ncbi:uncharacterized protein LOC109144126 [Corvus cornix cornix]|uniref:uncharacterized protein LOC109144126 n=1 Tax=Corvus cornix cornix TaxID=932674 RepID=UPI0019524A43|nr:uncharacterized protein LOC109144126 [Corvus cornix cornix]XP_019139212.2 uncharacterized protein LOC109144126 [Corvus cornix cornix]
MEPGPWDGLGWMDGWMDGRTDRQWSSKAQNPAKNQGVGNCHMRCSVAPLCPVLWCQHTWLRSAIPGGGGRAAIHGQVWPWHGQRGPTSPDQPLPGGVAVAGSTRRCCLPRGTGAAARNEWLCWSCVCTPAFHISSLASAGERGGFVGRWQSPLSSQGKGLLVPVSLKNTLPSLFAVPERKHTMVCLAQQTLLSLVEVLSSPIGSFVPCHRQHENALCSSLGVTLPCDIRD